uniref:Uncharacterized protein n=1 Tax=Oreochromis niloticus TaxID=8128 RepID=A0A669EAW8_ORENI
ICMCCYVCMLHMLCRFVCVCVLLFLWPSYRHIQVVFFDTFLSSTTFSVSFLDIKKLISIITMLRA